MWLFSLSMSVIVDLGQDPQRLLIGANSLVEAVAMFLLNTASFSAALIGCVLLRRSARASAESIPVLAIRTMSTLWLAVVCWTGLLTIIPGLVILRQAIIWRWTP